jgi:hypothetical protein
MSLADSRQFANFADWGGFELACGWLVGRMRVALSALAGMWMKTTGLKIRSA